jgi:hypothetical protein
MGKINPEKSSHGLQDMNTHLDLIPAEKITGIENNQKAYGSSLLDDDISNDVHLT